MSPNHIYYQIPRVAGFFLQPSRFEGQLLGPHVPQQWFGGSPKGLVGDLPPRMWELTRKLARSMGFQGGLQVESLDGRCSLCFICRTKRRLPEAMWPKPYLPSNAHRFHGQATGLSHGASRRLMGAVAATLAKNIYVLVVCGRVPYAHLMLSN